MVESESFRLSHVILTKMLQKMDEKPDKIQIKIQQKYFDGEQKEEKKTYYKHTLKGIQNKCKCVIKKSKYCKNKKKKL